MYQLRHPRATYTDSIKLYNALKYNAIQYKAKIYNETDRLVKVPKDRTYCINVFLKPLYQNGEHRFKQKTEEGAQRSN